MTWPSFFIGLLIGSVATGLTSAVVWCWWFNWMRKDPEARRGFIDGVFESVETRLATVRISDTEVKRVPIRELVRACSVELERAHDEYR
jgi:hypothetical protein